MRRCSETVILVGGVLRQTLTMYTENNHSTIYNELDECLFDGYFCEAVKVKDQEIAKRISLAKEMGLTAEIIK
jgi:hypothetical protein